MQVMARVRRAMDAFNGQQVRSSRRARAPPAETPRRASPRATAEARRRVSALDRSVRMLPGLQ